MGEWLSGNSRPHRSRICEPWRCKSSLAHQFQGVEATADRHRTFNPVWRGCNYLRLHQFIAGSSNRRTAPFEGANAGAIPAPAASFGKSSFDPPGGEIESRLAYTQKSRGQNLLGRPLPRCIIRSAPVSDTGGPGAKPGEATNLRESMRVFGNHTIACPNHAAW